MLTIVMYHYVRDLRRSRFPRIKGLELEQFRHQLDCLQDRYTVVTMEEVIATVQGDADLPEDSALLTFDDGFLDHYTCVFPILEARGCQGSFFPPSQPILQHTVLDVHKIHFVLASVPGPDALIGELRKQHAQHREAFGLPAWEDYWARCGRPNRFDSAEVIFLKRMLQVELPEELRHLIVARLFRKFVSSDEASFAAELYMSLDQLRLMERQGMYIGSHGHTHRWLNRLDHGQKLQEIRASLAFLRLINPEMAAWAVCYPYGGVDRELIDLLRDHGAAVGLTAEVAVADLLRNDPLLLPRLDTNDLPKEPVPSLVGGGAAR